MVRIGIRLGLGFGSGLGLEEAIVFGSGLGSGRSAPMRAEYVEGCRIGVTMAHML